MNYNVVVTQNAEMDLEEFVQYLLFEKKNRQAARNLLNDFELTKEKLEQTAGALKYCESPKLKAYGYKRINFISHRYFMLFRLEGALVIVDNIFHELQDYENKIK